MEDIAREYDYIHGIQRSRRVGVITFSSPTRQRKTMDELTKEQTEQMKAAWLPLALDYSLQPFKAGYTAAVNRECVWTECEDERGPLTGCGRRHVFAIHSVFCPYCGGKVVEGKV